MNQTSKNMFEALRQPNETKKSGPAGHLTHLPAVNTPTPVRSSFVPSRSRLGNQAMQRTLHRALIQAKLNVSTPGDKYEQEADRMADEVMRMSDSGRVQTKTEPRDRGIKRTCGGCEEELQREPMPEKAEEDLQAKEVLGETPQLTANGQEQIRSSRVDGRPLPDTARKFFEPRFGSDFRQVRVHTNLAAAGAAAALKAQAFTQGRDIVFGAGQYAPETSAGRRLLAHELSHVIQQRGAQPSANHEFPAVMRQPAAPLVTGGLDECPVDQIEEPEHPGECKDLDRETRELDDFSARGPVLETLTPNECFLLWNFRSERTDFGSPAGLNQIADQMEMDPSLIVHLTGYTDCKGDAITNANLRMNRAAELEDYFTNVLGIDSARIFVDVAELSSYVSSNYTAVGRARNRSVAISLQTVSLQPRDVKVVVKSFIAPIGGRIGFTQCTMLRLSSQRLVGLARSTDNLFSENPQDDRRGTGYRLYSERTFRVTCFNGNLLSVSGSTLDTDVGDECLQIPLVGRQCLHPPPMIIESDTEQRNGASAFVFSWAAKGRPHDYAEPAFQVVCPRTSRYIWHHVQGRIECDRQNVRVSTGVTGSEFPSHRVFENNVIRTTVPQQDFGRLWQEDPTDNTKVR